MDQRLTVKIPISKIDSDAIQEAIGAHQSEFEPLFARIIDIDDSRVEVIDDSLEIENFEFDPSDGTGVADVTFMSSFYAGCKDMNSETWHDASLPFNVIGKELIFDIPLPIRWRIERD